MEKEIKKCLIITGAPEDDIDYYKHYIDGRFIIGADSGYKKCVKLNIKPNLIIGDFDSSTKPDTDIETIVLPVRRMIPIHYLLLKKQLSVAIMI